MGAPSYKFNNELDSIINICSFCSACDEEKHSFIPKYGLKILCFYFARNLETIYYEYVNKGTLKDKLCNDLIYWLHNNLKNIHRIKKSEYEEIVNEFKGIWENITKHYQEITKDKICRISFEKFLSFHVSTKAKNVSKYCENYELIKNELDRGGNCGGYYKYLTKNSNIYKTISLGCVQDDGNNYCLGFNDCHTYNPQNLL
ncbi:PIR Superfamily Protein [Plasmodium ovale curtisi]|uniref:PIR Superfamily Protein n=1 Tax=Plasmodium ovale curtisi TaxID=864141 RepID=A0A1A8VNJ7_PLAOA|nr:PIR Superfamily Protein [Plasmodium ovale curtisi]